ncbi:hypothetical protein G9A89_004418 [Geosiphon pyriformis]|nr:hypothetical protein G9A89_004418 [Geosiphon pyriformis]
MGLPVLRDVKQTTTQRIGPMTRPVARVKRYRPNGIFRARDLFVAQFLRQQLSQNGTINIRELKELALSMWGSMNAEMQEPYDRAEQEQLRRVYLTRDPSSCWIFWERWVGKDTELLITEDDELEHRRRLDQKRQEERKRVRHMKENSDSEDNNEEHEKKHMLRRRRNETSLREERCHVQ